MAAHVGGPLALSVQLQYFGSPQPPFEFAHGLEPVHVDGDAKLVAPMSGFTSLWSSLGDGAEGAAWNVVGATLGDALELEAARSASSVEETATSEAQPTSVRYHSQVFTMASLGVRRTLRLRGPLTRE